MYFYVIYFLLYRFFKDYRDDIRNTGYRLIKPITFTKTKKIILFLKEITFNLSDLFFVLDNKEDRGSEN